MLWSTELKTIWSLNIHFKTQLCFLEVSITVVKDTFHSLQKNFESQWTKEHLSSRASCFSPTMQPTGVLPGVSMGAGCTPCVQQGRKISLVALKANKDLLCSLCLGVTLGASQQRRCCRLCLAGNLSLLEICMCGALTMQRRTESPEISYQRHPSDDTSSLWRAISEAPHVILSQDWRGG